MSTLTLYLVRARLCLSPVCLSAEMRACNSKWSGFTWVYVFLFLVSDQYSFFMFITYTTLAAGRVLFALTEKSTWVLIIRISLLSLPINKTIHALILLLCHWGEVHFCSRNSMLGFPLYPWEHLQVTSMTQIFKMEYCIRSISKLRWPTFYQICKPQLDFLIAGIPGLLQKVCCKRFWPVLEKIVLN